MDAATKVFVRFRARDRCEYCHLPQSALAGALQIDHVIAQQHLDFITDDESSLALACDRCNVHKGTNLTSIDPNTQQVVRLFHPREHSWNEHFEFVGPEIRGLTPVGRATVRLLQMNATNRLKLRRWLIATGAFERDG